jgi:hypothetical protein
MPIIERSPKECFDRFAKHVRCLFAATVSKSVPVITTAVMAGKEGRATLQFSMPDGKAVQLRTEYGRLFFYACQQLRTVPGKEKSTHRLETLRYWYRLQEDASPKASALMRWEYDKTTPPHLSCRNHLQAQSLVACGDHKLDLDKLHSPTGWVTLEELIRFLIVDLGIKPPCGKDWVTTLIKSEAAFYEEFTSKRYTPKVAKAAS